MKQFRNVLVYAETPDAACLERVVELAVRHGITMTVCDVIEPSPQLPDPEGTLARLHTLGWQRALERLRALCSPHMNRIELDYSVLVGNPFLVITEQVLQQRFDLVVHISDTGTVSSNGGLNPTGMHLIRKCPCAVWSMHPGEPPQSCNLVLAVDRDLAASTDAADDATLELLAAARFVARPGAVVQLVHAWQPFGADLLLDERAGFTATESERYLASIAEDYTAWFDALLTRLRAVAPELKFVPHLKRGTVTEVIPALVRQTRPELVLMRTIGTSNVPGVLIGTQAEAILSTTSTPILALKPRGFRTPLRFPARAASDHPQSAASG